VKWEEFVEFIRTALDDLLPRGLPTLGPSAHLTHDIGLDSFGVVVLVDEIEKKFDVVLPPSVEEPTLGHVFELLRSLQDG